MSVVCSGQEGGNMITSMVIMANDITLGHMTFIRFTIDYKLVLVINHQFDIYF